MSRPHTVKVSPAAIVKQWELTSISRRGAQNMNPSLSPRRMPVARPGSIPPRRPSEYISNPKSLENPFLERQADSNFLFSFPKNHTYANKHK
ncbi:hypothetical protein CCUS01_01056 [Colletotrichum cuscutae]|uniref:Uncharacterized protein n=1 Tax=Colletotrichum cuscutae TaxID=1209917 RepID=A0AAI9Y0G4_9PEZI|nr:hypothetical protein CCUS01_01056 [Colletotrichum cuscutae]